MQLNETAAYILLANLYTGQPVFRSKNVEAHINKAMTTHRETLAILQ